MATISKYAAYHTAITTGYTNPSNAYADDGVYATAAPGKNAEVSAYFGFPAFTTDEIPDGAIINSVTTEFKYHVSTTASIATQYWQTFKSTTALGTEQSDTSEPTSDVIKTHQVTSGITLTDLRSNDVARMRLRSARGNSNTAVTFYVDYVKITVDYTPAVVGAASLTGIGSLSATSLLYKIGTALLSGIGSLTVTAINTIIGSANLIGQGVLSATGSLAGAIQEGIATLSGLGSLTAIGNTIKQVAITLLGNGNLVAQGIKILIGQANLAGQGILSVIGNAIKQATITLSGIGSLTAQGIKIITGQAQLAGQGLLSAIGEIISITYVYGSAALSGVGQLVANGSKIILGQVQLLGQGVLSAIGTLIKQVSVALSGLGSLTASGIKTITVQVNLIGQGILSATGELIGQIIHYGATTLTGIGLLIANAIIIIGKKISTVGGKHKIKRFSVTVIKTPTEIKHKPISKRSKAAAKYITELKEKILETGVVKNTHKPYDPRYNKRYKVSEKQAARIAYNIAKEKGLRVGKYKGPHTK